MNYKELKAGFETLPPRVVRLGVGVAVSALLWVLLYAAGVGVIAWIVVPAAVAVALVPVDIHDPSFSARPPIQPPPAPPPDSHHIDNEQDADDRAARVKRAFVVNMSHEIRTPMSGLLGMVELLEASNLDFDQRRAVDLIRASAAEMLSLMNDVLDFSKLEAGGLTLEDTTFDLHTLIQSTVKVGSITAKASSVEVLFDIRPSVPNLVRGDPGRMRQVLANLLGNAVKFTRHGEVVVTVTTESEIDIGWMIHFAVRDTGAGIPADRLESIFNEYGEGDPYIPKTHGGAGLGLAISRQLVRRMGGELQVESEVGKGSTFSFSVLLTKADEEAAPRRREFSHLEGSRALVVGEDNASRELVTRILHESGMSVDVAANGESAIATVRSAASRYDVVLVDAFSRDRDGFQVARAFRADPDLCRVKVMLLTSAGQRGDARLCRELGIAAYLTKPASRPELLEAVAMVIAESSPDVAVLGNLVTRHSIQEARKRQRILVVEDHEVNRIVTETMLRERGHAVESVLDGNAAVIAARTGQYDVVLMDVKLPGVNGVDAMRIMRETAQGAALPIVAVTARCVQGERDRLLEAGFDGFLAKPFHAHELFAAVEGWGIAARDEGLESSRAEDAPIDVAALDATLREAGVTNAVDSLLSVFRADATSRMDALDLAIDQRDAGRIDACAHVFKSGAGTIRANQLADALHDVELAGRGGDVDLAVALMSRVRREYDRVEQYLVTTEESRDSVAPK